MKLLNIELLSHPVNWIKVGLMASTFVLGVVFISQMFMTEAVPSLDNSKPITPQPGSI